VRKYIILLCTLWCASCGRPTNVLPEKKMAQLLLDLQLADAYAIICYQSDTASVRNTFNRNIDTMKHYSALAMSKNEIDEASYKRSLRWYLDHPKEIDSAYSGALNLASQMQNTLGR
jgi:hypothetical protein